MKAELPMRTIAMTESAFVEFFLNAVGFGRVHTEASTNACTEMARGLFEQSQKTGGVVFSYEEEQALRRTLCIKK
jgi:hypothetical protein